MAGRSLLDVHGPDGLVALTEDDFAFVEEAARKLATFAHHGQLDKLRVDYIEHPAGVVALLRSSVLFGRLSVAEQQVAVIACWLHDVLEDTPFTADDLLRLGFHERVVQVVRLLTRTDEVTEDEYYAAIRQDRVARAGKVADLGHNLLPSRTAQLRPKDRERLAGKYDRSISALDAEGLVPTAA